MQFIDAYNARMNLDHLKIFIAVYRAGSFASVAKDFDMAASSVSRAIGALEAQLKVRLFQRTTRNLTPTQSGEHYFHSIEALVEEFDMVHQEMVEQSLKPFGRLRVTASVSFGQIVLAPLLKGFHQTYPNISLELTLSDTRSNIVNDQYDVAIRHGKLNDSSLVARKILDVNYFLVASPKYLRKTKPIAMPTDIQHHNLISFTYAEFDKAWHFRCDGTEEVVSIKPVLSASTALAIKECIKNDMGLAILPDWIVREELRSGKLKRVLPDWTVAGSNFDTAIWLVYPSRAYVPAKTTAFLDYLLSKTRLIAG